ncbi:MAG TPA: hypothetical protein VFY83_08920 [Anaerolineales bacterium]|nr:hypothetical protein [Anaerolineales bacterium]
MNLWRLYNLATGYGQRPSDLFELQTDVARWALDEACLVVGRRIENNLNSGKEPFDGFNGQHAQEFRSAKSRVKKKVKIKADGTW